MPDIKGNTVDVVEITLDDAIAICRCAESNAYPLCDGSHESCDSGKRPAVIKVVEE